MTGAFAVIVPLKSTARGKTRIGLPADQRRALALAMAMDTVRAAASTQGVGRVLVVAESATDTAGVGDLGAEVLISNAPGLNEAIGDGTKRLAEQGWAAGVAVLPADLPFLQAGDLHMVLVAALGHRLAVVADLAGLGTTVLTAMQPSDLRPHFGPGSFAAHRRAGASALPVPASSTARWDVDTMADLDRPGHDWALGAHSRAVLHPEPLSPPVLP